MLDTNIVSVLVRDPHGPVAARVAARSIAAGPDAACVSIITAAELRYGGARRGSAKLMAQIDRILDTFRVLPFDFPADAEYGRLRVELEAAGQPIGPNDLFIAAHALALDMVLVTANVREFGRVRGLSVENWLE